jgi:hypothetical protein
MTERLVLPFLAGVVAVCASAAPQAPARVDFDRDVRPILKTSCQACHLGPIAQADLRMDSRDSLLKGGVSGPAIVPGESHSSLLLGRVRGEGGPPRMPPGLSLSDAQIATLAAWVDAGAPWPESVVEVDFVRDIEPLLAASCYACHAGDKPRGQTRFDVKALRGRRKAGS